MKSDYFRATIGHYTEAGHRTMACSMKGGACKKWRNVEFLLLKTCANFSPSRPSGSELSYEFTEIDTYIDLKVFENNNILEQINQNNNYEKYAKIRIDIEDQGVGISE